MRHAPLLVLAALAACQPTDDTPKDDTADTDPVDTPDTDIDTDTETQVETDETDETVVDATISDLRLNTGSAFAEGDLVRIRDAVVTAVRAAGGDDNGFAVQDPTRTTFGGLYVFVGSSTNLPAPGQIVTVTGRYTEDDGGNTGAAVPSQTLTRLDVLDSTTSTSWSLSGTGGVVTPRPLTSTTFLGSAELYESMLVRIQDAGPLTVIQSPDASRTFTVRRDPTVGAVLPVGPHFYDLTTDVPALDAGDTLTAIAGVGLWLDGGYSVHPVQLADLAGFLDAEPDTDPPLDTDDTDLPPDTDDTDLPPDTDDTDLPVDDTFIDADTDLDTDGDTDQPTVLPTSPTNIHIGIHTSGQYLSLEGLIVTGTRFRAVPPASNAFVAQDPMAPNNGGIYVFIADDPNPPNIGDEVDIEGLYEEFPVGAPTPFRTLSRIVVRPTDPLASFTVVSTGNPLPAPVDVDVDDYNDPATIENYESMLVRLTEPGGLRVTRNVNTDGDFRVSPIGTTDFVICEEEFFDLRSLYNINTVDTMDAMIGVVHFEVTPYKLAPTTGTDAVNYVDN